MLFSRGQQRGTENISRIKTPEVFFLSSTLRKLNHEAIHTVFFNTFRNLS